MTTPTISVKPVHFDDYDGSEFERLVFAYHLRMDRWESLEWYGQVGSDLGRDIWGIRVTDQGRETVCIQCANRKRLTWAKAQRDIDSMTKASNGMADRVRFVCGGTVSAKLRDGIRDHALHRGIRNCEVWSGTEFEERLRRDTESLLRRFVKGEPFPDSPDELAQLEESAHAKSAKDAGGQSEEESPVERAMRLKREDDARIDRNNFLHSEQGVKKARVETEVVLRTVEEMAPQIAEKSGLDLKTNRVNPRVGIGLEICAQYASMQIDWHGEQHTLDGSYLKVRMWNGPFSGRTEEYVRNPRAVREERYKFDRDTAGVEGWRRANEERLLSSQEIAEACLNTLVDHAFKR